MRARLVQSLFVVVLTSLTPMVSAEPTAHATAGPFIFVDQYAFAEAARTSGGGAAAARVLEGLRNDTGATLVIAKAAAVLCTADDLDATAEAIARLHGRHASSAPRADVAHIVTIDRSRLLRESRAGKSLVAQAESLRKSGRYSNEAIQQAMNKAAEAIARAFEPILRQMAAEREANIVFDKEAVILAQPDDNVDITSEAIDRLDAVFPDVAVVVR